MELPNPVKELFNKEILPKLPVIRAHHLKILADVYYTALLQRITLPAEGYSGVIPGSVRVLIREWVQQHGSREHIKIREEGVEFQSWAENFYQQRMQDYIGSTPEEAATYDEEFYNALANLVSMPGNQQVLISPTPDSICKSCIIGDHCLATKEPHTLSEDDAIVDLYGQMMANFGFEVESRQAKFRFNGPKGYQDVKTIITNIGDVRKLLNASAKFMQEGNIPPEKAQSEFSSILRIRPIDFDYDRLKQNLRV